MNEQNDKFDMNVFDEPQCEEVYEDSRHEEDDKRGLYRTEDEDTYKGWPGDGSGLSDFDDYNQLEGQDY